MTNLQARTNICHMSSAEQRENVAAVLRLTRADLKMTQPERTGELLAGRSPDEIIREHAGVLYFEEDNSVNEIARWHELGFNTLTITDDDYPSLLREVHQAPAILYWQGTLYPDEVGISIVGSRKATPNQRQAAFALASKLSDAAVPVISGLAAGIDTAAHRGALAAGGRTVAVMGTGLSHTYPADNAALRKEITDRGGLVLTQFEPGQGPTRRGFPMRNEVMSGYGVGSIVMAADEKSGTRHQVRAAVRHGRAVVFTARIADEVSWARKFVDAGKAEVATSLDQAVEIAQGLISQRKCALQLFA